MGDGNSESEPKKRMRTEDSDGQRTISSSPRSGRPPLDADAPQPKRVACTNCRQSKLRCDSPKNPCSRCERLGLTCSTDSGYRRVSKRSKIDELEEHVHQLQAVLQNGSTSTIIPASNFNSPQGSNGVGAPLLQANLPNNILSIHLTNNERAPTQGPQAPRLDRYAAENQVVLTASESTSFMDYSRIPGTTLSRRPATKVRAIESIALGQQQIDSLFDIFFDHFHPFLPLIDPSKSPDDYYETSPFLFWTLICIASRRYTPDATLGVPLAKALKVLVWEKVSEPPLSIANIQALLFLSMWPYNTMRMWTDSSMTHVNLAISSAMHTGLHRADHWQEFSRFPRERLAMTENDLLERERTWAACNIVSQYMTLVFGYPPILSHFDWTMERACEVGNSHTLSDGLRYRLMILKFCHRVSTVMSSNNANSLGLPSENEHFLIMNLLEREFSELEGQLAKKLSTIDQLYLQIAKLYFQTFYWFGSSSQDRMGILKSYATAAKLVNQMTMDDKTSNYLLYAPTWLLLELLHASYLIFKVLNSSYSAFIDIEEGTSLYHLSISTLLRFSVQENDLAMRASSMLTETWRLRHSDLPGEQYDPPSLKLRSRLGASMTFDCLKRWRDRNLAQIHQITTYNGVESGPSALPSTSTPDFPPKQPQLDSLNMQQMFWDPLDDLNWNWDFDIPPVPTSSLG